MPLNVRDDDDTNEAWLIHEIARQFRVSFDRRSQHLDLTRSQWRVLSILRRKPGINQAKLAVLMEIEPITLVRLLDRMEKTGWVERRKDPLDRRANSVVLSDKVSGILTEMKAISRKLRQEALMGFSEEEHEQLVGYLQRLKTNISKVVCGEGEGACEEQ